MQGGDLSSLPPFSFFPLPFLSLPFHPFLPSPHFPLEVGPLNLARGLEERCKLLQRGRGGNQFGCILAFKSDIWGNIFTDFPENQLPKFHPSPAD